MRGFTKYELLVVIVILVGCCGLTGFLPGQFVAMLVVGWVIFLIKTIPTIAVEPAALTIGGVALVLVGIFTHWLARWLYGEGRGWRWRWTLAVVVIGLSGFGAGIALLGVIHETGWLLTSDEPWMGSIGGARGAARRSQSMNNLKQIALGCHNYQDQYAVLPPAGTFTASGEMMHSWETHLSPFVEIADRPKMDLPWNHPENAPIFRKPQPVFINSGVDAPADEEGFALSHYAVNSELLQVNGAVRLEDVTDGTSNTILAGEVKENFRPWGHPINWRDTALGINKSPDGFGGPYEGGANFVLADGSGRFLSNDIDPGVLRALETPRGGEKIADEGF